MHIKLIKAKAFQAINMDDYFDLGDFEFPITTSAENAQLWFNRGLLWIYGFNHEEAMACFDFALEADPNCAMAHWGRAYAVGPNYNMHWEKFDETQRALALAAGHEAAKAGVALADQVSPWEADMLRAVTKRFPQPDIADLEVLEAWNGEVAGRMR
ncbi:MAG: tetratricopeptide repeat protein [Pseudomonadota bacterium]